MSFMVGTYYENQKKKHSEYETVDSKVFVSNFQGLSLAEYCRVKEHLCETDHVKKSCDCEALINVALTILNNGMCCVSDVFQA